MQLQQQHCLLGRPAQLPVAAPRCSSRRAPHRGPLTSLSSASSVAGPAQLQQQAHDGSANQGSNKVAIFVEPSPFSHVSGMKNRCLPGLGQELQAGVGAGTCVALQPGGEAHYCTSLPACCASPALSPALPQQHACSSWDSKWALGETATLLLANPNTPPRPEHL